MTDVTKIDAFVQSSPHPAWLATSRGECLYVNPALERLTGLKSDQINQVDWRSFVLEEDRAAASAAWQRSLTSGTPYRTTVRLRGFDGVPVPVELIAFGHTLDDGTELWLFTGLHVHAATQQNPRLEAQLQATLNVIPAYTWYALPSGALTFVNERTGDYLGLLKDHPLRLGIDTGAEWDSHIPLLHPDDREESRKIWSICLQTGSARESNIRIRNAEGGYRWFLTQVEPLRASDGTLLYWIGVNVDIDDRKRAEEMVRQSERELRTIVEAIPAHIHSAQPDGYFDFVNSRWREYVGLPLEDLLGWKWTAAIHPADVEGLLEAWRRVLVTGEELAYEARTRRADGEFRWMFHRKVPLRNEQGDIVKWYGSSIDIEDRRRAEDALRRSEFYLAEGQRLAHVGSWAFDSDGFHYWSPELFRMHGLDPARKAPGVQEYLNCVHPQDRESIASLIERILTDGSAFDTTKRIVRSDGEVRYIRCVSAPIVNNQNLKKFIGSAMDVTEHELLTQELRRREAYLAEAQRLSHTGSFGWKPGSGEIVWSDETYRIFEYDSTLKPTLDSVVQRVHPDDRALVQQVTDRASQTGTDFEHEYRLLLADGRVKHVHAIARALRDASGHLEFIGAGTDITERKTAEEKIRRNEQELRTLIEAIPAYVGTNLPDGSVDFISESWLAYAGFSREQGMGWGWASSIHPEDLDRVLGNWQAAVAAGVPVEHELRCRRADGSYHWFLFRSFPLRDDGGKVLKWYGTLTNIDALKETEHALQTREHQLLGIIETIPSMLWATSPAGETTHLSQRLLEYCGAPLEELINRGWERVIHSDDREETVKAFARAISSGESYSAIHRLRRADGEYRWHHSMGEPLRDPDGRIIQWYGLAIDIDERKRAEDHLRDTRTKLAKASRLATVAELAASIAHELNQPLMAILANAQAARRWLKAAPPNVTEVNSSIERVVRDARAADETMQHIRALFKQESFDKNDVNVPDLLREVIRVVQDDPKKRHVPIERNFEESLPMVNVDRIQIQQVFINLIVNAIEASEGQQMSPMVVLRAVTDSNGMLVQVIDNGPGVDDPDRIFDAFMTTKEKGMGIGLAVSRSIVEAHGGRLWAENNKTGGATFNVVLPLTHASLTTAQIQEYA